MKRALHVRKKIIIFRADETAIHRSSSTNKTAFQYVHWLHHWFSCIRIYIRDHERRNENKHRKNEKVKQASIGFPTGRPTQKECLRLCLPFLRSYATTSRKIYLNVRSKSRVESLRELLLLFLVLVCRRSGPELVFVKEPIHRCAKPPCTREKSNYPWLCCEPLQFRSVVFSTFFFFIHTHIHTRTHTHTHIGARVVRHLESFSIMLSPNVLHPFFTSRMLLEYGWT